MTHLKTDKPQTKLGILNMAVEVIMTLEQQVRGTYQLSRQRSTALVVKFKIRISGALAATIL